MKLNENDYLLGLSRVAGLGPVRVKQVLAILGSAKSFWEISEKNLAELKLNKDVVKNFLDLRSSIGLLAEKKKLREDRIEIVGLNSEKYPSLLRETYDPPIVLYVRGNLEPESTKVGVVGARLVTSYGSQVTLKLSADLATSGITVVSGLANGVDGLAHKASLEVGGRTIAVLGSGLNCIYPSGHQKLAENIANSGALVSEYPPDFLPVRGSFPARNRIISGMSVGVVVTEAGENSGSLITARVAIDQDRAVYAVPGSIFSKQSKGTNNLLKQGAKPVDSAQDILEDLEVASVPVEFREIKGDNPTEDSLLASMNGEPVHFDDLVRSTKLSPGEVGAALTVMVISGKLIDLGGSYYGKRH